MDWKSLIFTDESEKEIIKEEEVIKPKNETLSFPKEIFKEPKETVVENKGFMVTDNAFESKLTIEPNKKSSDNLNPHLTSIIDVYDKGFEKMNKDGVDFYEFYKSLIIGDINNLQLYPMAFNMLKNLNPNFTKESAIDDSKFYLDNINTAYKNLKSNGLAKKESLVGDKNSEKENLTSTINDLKIQIEQLNNELRQSQKTLEAIDQKYEASIKDVELKLDANEIAKNKLTTSITTVVDNLKTTIN